MTVTITHEGAIAVVTIDNPPVSALSQALRQALVEAVSAIDTDATLEAAVLICAGRTFIAGADVSEFGKPSIPAHLPDVVAAVESARKPWVAAIHGSALGGGLEVALGCAYRVAVRSASLGLPEVKLGIIPGAAAAVDLVTSGSPIDVRKAEGLGLVDGVAEGELLPAAIAFARGVADKPRRQPISAVSTLQLSSARPRANAAKCPSPRCRPALRHRAPWPEIKRRLVRLPAR
jgi:3-hydroxyacyl-CoA dehydrogenase